MDMGRAMPHYKKAETLLARQPESWRQTAFYASMAAAYSFTRRIGEGLATAKRAMEISERLDQPFLRDAFWSTAAVVSSVFLIHSGSVNEGLRLADQARRRADPIENTMTGSLVALGGGGNYLNLRSSRDAQDWFSRELGKPRTANAVRRAQPYAPLRNDNVPLLLRDLLVTICIEAGELTKARAYLAEAETTDKPAELLFFEGEWELADKTLIAGSERSRTAGNRLGELWFAPHLARLHRLTGECALAAQFLQRALEISLDGGDVLFELATRSAFATMAADAGDAGEALQHLQRCRQIVGAGENWFGLAGSVERAEAVMAAAQGEYLLAESHFEKAIATFQRYCLPWEEADTFQYWGRALLAAGEHARAIEKFDAAIEIYRSRGASVRFVEYVMADKMRAQGSNSTDAEGQPAPTDLLHANAPAVTPQLQAPTSKDRSREAQTLARDFKGLSYSGESQRVVATLLFIDIVSSTEHVTKLRDRGWVELRKSFFELIRRQLASFNGLEIDAAGDGMLAIFDRPAAAIHCAFAMSQGVEKLGLQMRAGIHTGECEMVGGDAIGIAVHIGARVAAQAGPNEVMVSSTVRDLLVGGEITFVDRGVSELKGIPGEWRLYAVEQHG